jgi:GGDEF domain-containing protein
MEAFEVLEHITDGVIWLDDGWKFRYINRSAQILLHRREEDLLCKEIWSEYPDLLGTKYEAAYRGAALGGEVRIATEFYQPLSTWFEVRAFPAERGVVVLFRDVTKDRTAQEELQRQATYDELTGLYNRREMMRRLEEALASRPETRIALLFVDLDKFKDINDSYGHGIGDSFLLAIANKLSVVGGSQATVARIGGDEFVLILEGDQVARALNAAEQAIEASAIPTLS